VTKAKYLGADKAVVFSSHGFQSGAIEAAKLYGIPLFLLSQLDDVPDQFLAPDKVEYIQIYDVVQIKPDGSRFALTEEPMRLRYHINETILTYPTRDIILAELIRGYEKKLDGCAVDDVLHQQVRLVPPGRTTFPSMERDEPILVSFVQWKMVNRVGRRLKDRPGYDPALFAMPYEIKDILSGNIRYLEGDAIEGGELNDVTPGSFYRFRNWGIYYCEGIDDGLARMILIECYQHGKFVQVKFAINRDNIWGYEEVTNSDDLDRLHWRVREWYKIG